MHADTSFVRVCVSRVTHCEHTHLQAKALSKVVWESGYKKEQSVLSRNYHQHVGSGLSPLHVKFCCDLHQNSCCAAEINVPLSSCGELLCAHCGG